jgi:hypothetical protein
MTLALADAISRGFCPYCSTPTRPLMHGEGSRCPNLRRERAAPCRGATLRESMAGAHTTFNLDLICDRCRAARASFPTGPSLAPSTVSRQRGPVGVPSVGVAGVTSVAAPTDALGGIRAETRPVLPSGGSLPDGDAA